MCDCPGGKFEKSVVSKWVYTAVIKCRLGINFFLLNWDYYRRYRCGNVDRNQRNVARGEFAFADRLIPSFLRLSGPGTYFNVLSPFLFLPSLSFSPLLSFSLHLFPDDRNHLPREILKGSNPSTVPKFSRFRALYAMATIFALKLFEINLT